MYGILSVVERERMTWEDVGSTPAAVGAE